MDCMQIAKYKGTVKGRSKPSYNSALERGLISFAGMEKTKSGPDEKEVAYIIRQNCFFRTLFSILIVGLTLATYIFTTKLKLEIVERDVITEEIKHRKSEHGAQLKLLTVMLQRKEGLEDQAELAQQVVEFRSSMLKRLGSFESLLEAQNQSQSAECVQKVLSSYTSMRKKVEENLELLNTFFLEKSASAEASLMKLNKDLIHEIEEDEEERGFYLQKLAQYGISGKNAAKLVEDKHAVDIVRVDTDAEMTHIAHVEKEAKESEKDVQQALEDFFERVRHLKFPKVRRSTLQRFEKYYYDVKKELEDNTKEIDPEAVLRGFNQLLVRFAPTVAKYDPSGGETAIEFLRDKVHEAKLAMHKVELLDLYQAWKISKKITTIQVLARVENLLFPDDAASVKLRITPNSI